MREIFQLVGYLPDTARIQRGVKIGIRQEKGPPVVGIVRRVSYRKGLVAVETIDADGNPTGTTTVSVKRTTYLF